VILGGGVAVCILLSAHRAVIFAIAQLSCLFRSDDFATQRKPFTTFSVTQSKKFAIFAYAKMTELLKLRGKIVYNFFL